MSATKRKRSSPLDKVLGRLDDLDSVNLTVLIQRLARERRLLETVFDSIQEGILVVTETGIIEYSNVAADRLIGLKPTDLGKAILWKMVPDLARSIDFNIKRAYQRSDAVSQEVELHYPEHRYIRLYIVPLLEEDTDRETSRSAMLLTDITQDKISTAQLIENEKTSSILLLAAGVAHELGNPLNSLNIHLQLIANHFKKINFTGTLFDKISHSLDVCKSEINRLDGIIQHFLEAIRPTPPDRREIQLLDVIEDVLTVAEDELRNLNIKIDVEVDETLPLILADRNQLKQIFFNVLKNAMEAMREGGHLKIRARSDDQAVFVHFADSGTGMTQETLSQVFQPYFTTKKEGTGLGMMIVQRILRDHGGKVGIQSRPGTGTVVTLEFPQKHLRTPLLEEH